ncbi:MAG: DNA repair protein RadC [Chloroflexi bacterium]|nr:DNA repair protein RadC [Chloroflexota bacterium]
MAEQPDGIEYHPRIKEMPTSERPRERLMHYGAGALSNAELLAIVLRAGVRGQNVLELAQSLLTRFGGLRGLARASARELAALKGVGEAKASQVLAALELGKRMSVESPAERPQIQSPRDVVNLVQADMSLLEQEHLRVLLLDAKNRVQETKTVYVGRLDGVDVRLGDLFRDAVRTGAAAMVVVHNHPSGDPTPSREDVQITAQIRQAGDMLGITLLDHVIIGGGRFVSLKERGLGF